MKPRRLPGAPPTNSLAVVLAAVIAAAAGSRNDTEDEGATEDE